MIKKYFITGCCLLTILFALAQQKQHPENNKTFDQQSLPLPALQNKWQIQNTESICFKVSDSNTPYTDHIEMSGEKTSVWIRYTVDTARHLQLNRTVVFPSFRMQPNDTHASLMFNFTDEDLPRFFISNKPLRPAIINGLLTEGMDDKVSAILQYGIMQINSSIHTENEQIGITRKFFPSVDKAAVIETITFNNNGTAPVPVSMEYLSKINGTDGTRSFPRQHYLICSSINPHTALLQPKDSVVFGIAYQAADEPVVDMPDMKATEQARIDRLRSFAQSLQLETPDDVLNTEFEFAKRRIGESIYLTKAGPMMSPGGLRYYAAIWANDNAEYANPFYPFTGDSLGNAAAINTFSLFAKYMNPGYKPIPSSVIAEGDGYWGGAGDRGDQAMIAYGAGRFALAYGNKATAQKLWPLIQWCLEFSKRKKNTAGVIQSDNDELEGRFPAGEANLATSCLYYDALLSAIKLGKVLELPASQIRGYKQESIALQKAIEKYFGAGMKGFDTYRYYRGNTLLRSWICVPLTMGILDRAGGTINALFSPALFSAEGFLTQEGSNTFWDRSTLYALRGIFAAGETGKALAMLHYYSQRRLLGSHVPYPVEAYPEGNQRHLAAESALYCRVFTEGMFGIRPTGLSSFNCTPLLPKEWNRMAMNHIRAFNDDINIEVERQSDKLKITIVTAVGKKIIRTIKEGNTIAVAL